MMIPQRHWQKRGVSRTPTMTERDDGEYHEAYGGSAIAKPRPPDFDRCAQEVADPPWYIHFHQCSRKRGHGPGKAYCKQHAAMRENNFG